MILLLIIIKYHRLNFGTPGLFKIPSFSTQKRYRAGTPSGIRAESPEERGYIPGIAWLY